MSAPRVPARFTLGEPLGAGTAGQVFRAFDQELEGWVALKTVPRGDSSETQRLKDEFRLLRGVHHNNLVRLYELYVEDDVCLFTMEEVPAAQPFGDALALALKDPGGQVAYDLVRQLVQGVAAVHDAGVIHRDIKPGNVLVDAAGRVVVLDFGVSSLAGHSELGVMAGSPDYMAPEALWGQVQQASDWFSVGCMLFEAVSGALPFNDADITQRFEWVQLPEPVAQALPEWLGGLILELLNPDASARPDTTSLRARFTQPGEAVVAAPSSLPFVGRRDELEWLRLAREGLRGGDAAWLQLRGPSGQGKSRLLDAFTSTLATDPGALVLRARCHHSERVSFRAAEALVQSLVRALLARALTDPSWAPEFPGSADPAAVLFPGLRRVLGEQAGAPLSGLPSEQRRASLRGLRELLTHMSQLADLVILVDDAQWGDAESARLLAQALDGLPVMVVLSMRDEEEPGPLVDTLVDLEQLDPANARTLPPLPSQDAVALLSAVWAGASSERVQQAVEQAGGQPLLLSELAYLQPDAFTGSVNELVSKRLDAMQDSLRAVAEVVSLAEAPLPRAVVMRASGLVDPDVSVTFELERQRLVRVVPQTGRVIASHDRIREVLSSSLAEGERERVHGRITDALDAASLDDPGLLLPHLLGCKRVVRAKGVALQAAESAAETLAFEREASMLGVAADCETELAAEATLHDRAAEAWQRAGLGPRASQAFLEAVRCTEQAQLDPLVLRGRRAQAAGALLRHGENRQGVELFRGVLADIGVSLPSSAGWATVLGSLRRLGFMLSGRWSRVQPVDSLDPSTEERHDLLWSSSNSLGSTDVPRAFALTGLYLNEVVKGSTRRHLAQALGAEAMYEAMLGGAFFTARVERLFKRLDELCEGHEDPIVRGGRLSYRSLAAWQLGRWRESLEYSQAFTALVRTELHGRDRDLTIGDMYNFSNRYLLGEFEGLVEDVPRAVQAAEDRGDRLARVVLGLGTPSMVHLIADEPDAAREALVRSEPLRNPTSGLDAYYTAQLECSLHLYEQNPVAALQALDRAWPVMKAEGLLTIHTARCIVHALKGRALLQLLNTPRGDKRARRELKRCAAVLKRASNAPGRAMYVQISGAMKGEAGWRAAAAQAYQDADMAAFAAALEPETRDLPPEVRDPERFARMLAPG